jgi:hypothetical protein
MTRRDYCSRCAKRLPASSSRCVACGGSPQDKARPSRRIRTVGAVLFAALAIAAIGFSNRYVPAVTDWYSGMVIRYLPEPALRFAPADDDLRAFYVCAKSVVKEIEDEASVVTFAAATEDLTVALGSDMYRVDSYVEEARADGSTLRRPFTCTVRLEGDNWRLEEVELKGAGTAVASRDAA